MPECPFFGRRPRIVLLIAMDPDAVRVSANVLPLRLSTDECSLRLTQCCERFLKGRRERNISRDPSESMLLLSEHFAPFLFTASVMPP